MLGQMLQAKLRLLLIGRQRSLMSIRVSAVPEAPSAALVAVLDKGQQLSPGHQKAAQAPQQALRVSLQSALCLHLHVPICTAWCALHTFHTQSHELCNAHVQSR